jgi:hypothetical protein
MLFKEKKINSGFILLFAANGGAAVMLFALGLAFHNPLIQLMALIFAVTTILIIGFMLFLRWRFKDL